VAYQELVEKLRNVHAVNVLPGGCVREPVGDLNEADRQELVRILKT
jgi:hypothetical protein